MQDQSKSGNGENGQITDAWWASLARSLLHPVQVQIIEALRQSGGPLSARDLAEIVGGATAGSLTHHLRRLRKVGALAYAETPTTRNITDIRYRLVQRPRDGR